MIDFRNRPPTPEFLEYFQPDRTWALGKKAGAESLSPAFTSQSLKLWLTELREAGIGKAVVTGRNSPGLKQLGNLAFIESMIPNDRIGELQAQYPEAIVGFGAPDLTGRLHDPVQEVRRCIIDLNLLGIFIEPQRAIVGYPDDERLFPVYEECNRLQVPVMIMSGPHAGSEIKMASPAAIDRVANSFPELQIICAHGCWPYVTEAIAVAFKHPTVHLSPDVYTFLPGGELYVQAANGFMHDQLVFATAYPILQMSDTVHRYQQLGWRDASVLHKVMAANAQRLLNLDKT